MTANFGTMIEMEKAYTETEENEPE